MSCQYSWMLFVQICIFLALCNLYIRCQQSVVVMKHATSWILVFLITWHWIHLYWFIILWLYPFVSPNACLEFHWLIHPTLNEFAYLNVFSWILMYEQIEVLPLWVLAIWGSAVFIHLAFYIRALLNFEVVLMNIFHYTNFLLNKVSENAFINIKMLNKHVEAL